MKQFRNKKENNERNKLKVDTTPISSKNTKRLTPVKYIKKKRNY